MGIATWHEVLPHRDDAKGSPAEARGAKAGPRKPSLDEMGPGIEAVPHRGGARAPGSTLGKPGMRGGRKPPRRR
jgi:excinuclease ABC subunit B